MAETYYLMDTEDGLTVRVPASRLDDWMRAQQERGSEPLSRQERQFADRIVQDLFGRSGQAPQSSESREEPNSKI